MDYLLGASIILCIIMVLALIFLKTAGATSGINNSVFIKENAGQKKKLPCILCGSLLVKGQNLKSEKYTIGEEIIVHTFGCPNCWGNNASRPRTCPVCKRPMRADDYLSGKMWKRKNGKLHLHIDGCPACAGK